MSRHSRGHDSDSKLPIRAQSDSQVSQRVHKWYQRCHDQTQFRTLAGHGYCSSQTYCVHVTRVSSPFLHMHEGVVQFEQWRLFLEKMQSMVKGSLAPRYAVSPTASRRHAARTLSSPYCSAARTRTLFSWPTVSLCHCTWERSMPSDDPSRLTINTVRWHGRNCLKKRLRLPGVLKEVRNQLAPNLHHTKRSSF